MKDNKDLGYDEFFEANRKKLDLTNFAVARVTAQQKGSYTVKNKTQEYLAKIRGKKMFNATSREDYPAVGDWVAITELENKQAVIESVLPRKTVMKRKHNNKDEVQLIATNIDVALVVEAVGRDFSLNRFERYFSIASEGETETAIVLNKIDLISEEELEQMISQIKARFGNVDIIPTSTKTLAGIVTLRNYIKKEKTYCFLGSSGVGKSSLINKLLEKTNLKTEEIGQSSGRGKHVTTSREMYFLENGGIVIDNPGVREVGLTDENSGIENLFDEITVLAQECKFADCTHIHEPGCKVLEALETRKLDKGKYSNYISLKKETEYYDSTQVQKKEKNRRFGKFIKKAKDGFKKHGYKNY